MDTHVTKFCYHCGAANALRLGNCRVCGEPVCDHCGNTDHIGGSVTAIHETCRSVDQGEGFSMIKFVK